jgi:hypothetical protein
VRSRKRRKILTAGQENDSKKEEEKIEGGHLSSLRTDTHSKESRGHNR